MEKTQENRHILFYTANKNQNFTSFLPLDLKDEKDKSFFEFLSDPNNGNFSNEVIFKLPLEQKDYEYLLNLQVENFNSILISDFFKKHNLEEWIL